MNHQLDKFKNKNDELVGLKKWPDIAFALTFITKSQLPQTKELIKYGHLSKTVNDLCRRAGQIPKKYVPKGAKGFVSATDDDK